MRPHRDPSADSPVQLAASCDRMVSAEALLARAARICLLSRKVRLACKGETLFHARIRAPEQARRRPIPPNARGRAVCFPRVAVSSTPRRWSGAQNRSPERVAQSNKRANHGPIRSPADGVVEILVDTLAGSEQLLRQRRLEGQPLPIGRRFFRLGLPRSSREDKRQRSDPGW